MEVNHGNRWTPPWRAVATACMALSTGVGVTAADDPDPVEDMLAMIEGTYRSVPGEPADAELPDLLDRRARVTAPALGDHVVYWQLNSGSERDVYRQRLLVFVAADNGEIVQTTWSLRKPEKFVDAFDNPDLFTDLGANDVEPSLPTGCEQIWHRTPAGWYGSVSADSCRVWSQRRQMWRRIGAEAKVTADALWQAERGFDDDGTQVFGTKTGELYRLDRITD
ncbi:MAG: chromophore lyase CpcT/CpeT [Gammaproteobacteria bacterium]